MAKAHWRFRYRTDRKAEMGIGTMIIFIAMVIVAAVASTLLISTAALVQQQAQETGRLAIADVSTGFKVINLQGDRMNFTSGSTLNDTISMIEVKLELEAGSPAINMSQVVIEITDGTSDADLNFSDTDTSATLFNVTILRDPDNTYSGSHPIVSSGGLIKVRIDAAAVGLDLKTQAHLVMKIIPKHGVPTYETFDTPSVYADRYVPLE
jgi:flagellin FlaB